MPRARKKPYTQKELDESVCDVCGKQARFQWNACADGNVWRRLCSWCDVQINIAVLKILDPSGWQAKIKAYCKSIGFRLKKGDLQ